MDRKPEKPNGAKSDGASSYGILSSTDTDENSPAMQTKASIKQNVKKSAKSNVVPKKLTDELVTLKKELSQSEATSMMNQQQFEKCKLDLVNANALAIKIQNEKHIVTIEKIEKVHKMQLEQAALDLETKVIYYLIKHAIVISQMQLNNQQEIQTYKQTQLDQVNCFINSRWKNLYHLQIVLDS